MNGIMGPQGCGAAGPGWGPKGGVPCRLGLVRSRASPEFFGARAKKKQGPFYVYASHNTVCKGVFGSHPRAALHLPHHCFGARLVRVCTCSVTMTP
jgi:hypothetical protein